MPYYKVQDKLIEATSETAAIIHYARPRLKIEKLSAKQVVDAVKEGSTIETADRVSKGGKTEPDGDTPAADQAQGQQAQADAEEPDAGNAE